MSPGNTWFRLSLVSVFALSGVGFGASALAQDAHLHTPGVSGMPQGVPLFCANPTVTSVATGGWLNPKTWSTNEVPGANDRIAIGAGHTVTYDRVSDAKIECIEVRGKLTFKTDANTRMKVVTVMVLEGGSLEIGSPGRPLAPGATAEIVIADQPFNPAIDPSQIGNGLVALGKVTMHGGIKTPTFLRVSREPLAGETTLTLERPVQGWQIGDHLVIPDTRQLRDDEHGRNYKPEDENVQVKSISGTLVTLAAPLAYDHKGARNAAGILEFLPHVGNVSRNVIVRSENPAGTRGHTIFISHADIDVRYAEFKELGRTKMGILNSTELDSEGHVASIGTNQIGRYAVHFHHDFGPKDTPASGYQFMLVGNAVDGSTKWGITIHRSHYGLIQDNVVYNTRGAGIVTEDGSESFDVFDHNFSMRTAGSRDAVEGNGYSSTLPNPGGDGSAFWFRGPNNYIRNNVAATAAESGFGLPVTALGMVRIPQFKGADTSKASESLQLDTAHAAVLEFSNNEAYGAMQSGVAWAWSGSISNFTVWHSSRYGITVTPTDNVVVENLTARGDSTILASAVENPVGVWVGDYASKNVVVANADVQGMRIGVSSPFFYGHPSESSGAGSLTIENSYFRTYIGVNVATAYIEDAKGNFPSKKAVVRSSMFDPLNVKTLSLYPPETISMNHGMAPGDTRPRGPIVVYDYNKQPDNNFRVYYSYQAPTTVAPCHDTMPGIGGWVCR
jgi:hypothetical protein